jgi:chromosome segregation ATPase
MSKLVQILLSKQLTVNLGRDDQGEAKTIVLQPGLQEVEQDIAEHWFVKAHSQAITSSDALSGELQVALDAANAAIESLTNQSEAATDQINQLTDDLKNRDKEVADLKIQLAKAQQTQSEAATDQINQLTDDLKNRDKEVADLKIQLAKAQQTQSEAAKPADSPADTETRTKGK